MVRKHLLLLLIVLVLAASYLREVVFLQINSLIKNEVWNYSNMLPFEFLKNQSKETLLNYKWLFTILFSISIGGSTYISIKMMTTYLWMNRIVNIIFASLIGAVGILASLFFFTFRKELFYPLLRTLIGLFQTPLLLIILGIITYAVNNLSKLQNPKN